MAHIFKNPTVDNKGIIVFTHKEWPFLLNNALSSIQELKEYYYSSEKTYIFLLDLEKLTLERL